MNDQQLVRKLTVTILIKLVLLVALWWGFIRDQRVSVDAEAMAGAVQETPTTIQQSGKGYNRHGH